MRFPLIMLTFLVCVAPAFAADKPNILWLTSEDNGPHLGCYGDDYATSPHIDSIAAKGMIYLNAWSTAPVCAPARTTIISGLYPPSTGSEHMRSMTRLPAAFKMYPYYLRQAGYYCTNNSKEDYNLAKEGDVWHESGRKAHWKNRSDGQPFFAIFNYTVSHESRIRKRPHDQVHDPAKVYVPKYHPDHPAVRQDWAQYHDKITEMDAMVGNALTELNKAGLAQDTIIFYYGDHGSGMPRSKRWPYNSGLRVPLVIHVPDKWKHLAPKEYKIGGSSDRLVGFIDLAPTVLSVAGVNPPKHMQGHAFMGKFQTPEQPYGYGFRGRMDERYDMLRVVRNKRYIYIRNYMPHKVYGQYIEYMFKTPTTTIWKQLFDEGKLNAAQSRFWQTKPAEELYDLQADPDEVNNLAQSPDHQAILVELRNAQEALALKIKDVGFLPEGSIHARSQGSTPYEMGHDAKKYDVEAVVKFAGLASSLKPDATSSLVEALQNQDDAVRYWAAMGLLMRETAGVKTGGDMLRKVMKTDVSPYVRIIAAEALGRYGNSKDVAAALKTLISHANIEEVGVFHAMLALNALDAMDDRAKPVIDQIKALPTKPATEIPRMKAYVPNLIKKTLADIQ